VGYLLSKWEPRIDDQAELLMVIVAGVMLVTGLAFSLGLQPLFATLIMGAVTTNLSLMHRLVYIELRQIEQPLYIAFFVLAGASLHLELLPGLGLVGITYLLARVAGKICGVYFVSRWKNFSRNIRRYLGLGMLVQAGVAIGLIDLVNSANPEIGVLITPIVLATILIYETAGPPIVRYILFKSGDAKNI
jgi:Kef-type K+ transport system membrane component KefB